MFSSSFLGVRRRLRDAPRVQGLRLCQFCFPVAGKGRPFRLPHSRPLKTHCWSIITQLTLKEHRAPGPKLSALYIRSSNPRNQPRRLEVDDILLFHHEGNEGLERSCSLTRVFSQQVTEQDLKPCCVGCVITPQGAHLVNSPWSCGGTGSPRGWLVAEPQPEPQSG